MCGSSWSGWAEMAATRVPPWAPSPSPLPPPPLTSTPSPPVHAARTRNEALTTAPSMRPVLVLLRPVVIFVAPSLTSLELCHVVGSIHVQGWSAGAFTSSATARCGNFVAEPCRDCGRSSGSGTHPQPPSHPFGPPQIAGASGPSAPPATTVTACLSATVSTAQPSCSAAWLCLPWPCQRYSCSPALRLRPRPPCPPHRRPGWDPTSSATPRTMAHGAARCRPQENARTSCASSIRQNRTGGPVTAASTSVVTPAGPCSPPVRVRSPSPETSPTNLS